MLLNSAKKIIWSPNSDVYFFPSRLKNRCYFLPKPTFFNDENHKVALCFDQSFTRTMYEQWVCAFLAQINQHRRVLIFFPVQSLGKRNNFTQQRCANLISTICYDRKKHRIVRTKLFEHFFTNILLLVFLPFIVGIESDCSPLIKV